MTSDLQGVAAYLLVVGVAVWLATRLVGKPFLAYRAVRADIARCLVFYANVPFVGPIDTPLPPRTHEARLKYRELASELVACSNTLAFYQVWAACKILPTRKDLDSARGNLIGLSNSVGDRDQVDEITRRKTNIRRLLRIKLD